MVEAVRPRYEVAPLFSRKILVVTGGEIKLTDLHLLEQFIAL